SGGEKSEHALHAPEFRQGDIDPGGACTEEARPERESDPRGGARCRGPSPERKQRREGQYRKRRVAEWREAGNGRDAEQERSGERCHPHQNPSAGISVWGSGPSRSTSSV